MKNLGLRIMVAAFFFMTACELAPPESDQVGEINKELRVFPRPTPGPITPRPRWDRIWSPVAQANDIGASPTVIKFNDRSYFFANVNGSILQATYESNRWTWQHTAARAVGPVSVSTAFGNFDVFFMRGTSSDWHLVQRRFDPTGRVQPLTDGSLERVIELPLSGRLLGTLAATSAITTAGERIDIFFLRYEWDPETSTASTHLIHGVSLNWSRPVFRYEDLGTATSSAAIARIGSAPIIDVVYRKSGTQLVHRQLVGNWWLGPTVIPGFDDAQGTPAIAREDLTLHVLAVGGGGALFHTKKVFGGWTGSIEKVLDCTHPTPRDPSLAGDYAFAKYHAAAAPSIAPMGAGRLAAAVWGSDGGMWYGSYGYGLVGVPRAPSCGSSPPPPPCGDPGQPCCSGGCKGSLACDAGICIDVAALWPAVYEGVVVGGGCNISCHGFGDQTAARTYFVSSGLVKPFNAYGSTLYRRLQGSLGERMPKGGPYLSAAVMAQLRRWIDLGAL